MPDRLLLTAPVAAALAGTPAAVSVGRALCRCRAPDELLGRSWCFPPGAMSSHLTTGRRSLQRRLPQYPSLDFEIWHPSGGIYAGCLDPISAGHINPGGAIPRA